ncbi:MAG: BrnA antitoxin family protein [Bryocella sp.]
MKPADTGKTVSFTREAGAPFNAADLAQLASLKARRIDLSDLPESPEDADWKHFVPEIRKPKQVVSLRLDPEVLDYFKHTGKRYQSLINGVLRAYMHAHEGKRPG